MAQPEFFKETFDRHAVDGCIGDSLGEPAYAYLRVSSDGQAEDGRSGLPRQIEHCHEAALQSHLKIPWELVFADDDSGFDFRERPELSRLRKEFKYPKRRANAVVIEYIDRLSRNADWHQGFLLDEMKVYGLRVAFWKQYNSRIERAVMGAISQEGMEQEKQRMAEGNIHKAKDNRVTARYPAFGYILVDGDGKASSDAKKDTHYALQPAQARVVDVMYRKVAIEGWSVRRLAQWLDGICKPPQTAKHWHPRTVGKMLRNEIYKGEFYAHRYEQRKVPAVRQKLDEPTRFTIRKVERPKEDWIKVNVPAIVSAELWDLANRVLDRNRIMAQRNGTHRYLLTGLVKCATCKYSYTGGHRVRRKRDKVYHIYYYRDAGSVGMMGSYRDVHCKQSQISCQKLDDSVWRVVSNALLHPEIIIEAMEHGFESGPNAELLAEIALLEQSLEDLEKEDEDLYRAYRAGAYTPEELAKKRTDIKARGEQYKTKLADRNQRVITREKLEVNKQRVLEQSRRFKEQGITPDAPFEIKQTILKLIVDEISLNVDEGYYDMIGVIPGRFYVDDSSAIAGTSMDRGSSPPPA